MRRSTGTRSSRLQVTGRLARGEILARARAPLSRAKVILSVRDPDAWFDSVQATIAPFISARGTHPSPHVNAIAEMANQAIVAQVFDNRMSEREHATRIFREHIAEVKSEIPAHRLLTFDLRDGWEPLCDFLEVEVPGIPFPRTNSSKEFVDEEWKQGQAQATPT